MVNSRWVVMVVYFVLLFGAGKDVLVGGKR